MTDQPADPSVTVADRERHASSPARELALDCVTAGIEAAHPERVVADALSLDDNVLTATAVDGTSTTRDLATYDRVLVVGAGNAAGHFAAAVEGLLGDRIDDGAVVTDDPVETERIAVLPGDHPTPSEAGVESARDVREVAADAGESDLVLGLITGGGSALLAAPASEIGLDDLRETTESLLASGATISEINAVRKHLSAVKGGRLARAAAPADVLGLAVSDVTGDDPAVIASGPLSPDPTTYADALGVLDRYGIDAPAAVTDRLERGAAGELAETPNPGDPAFDGVDFRVVASARTALNAARDVAAARGYEPLVLSSRVRGEAREAAKTHAAVAEECRAAGEPVEPPAVLLSAGEVTVTLGENPGKGGPNQEFALSAALELGSGGGAAGASEGVAVASVDTDGIDGATDAAGALVDDRLVGDGADGADGGDRDEPLDRETAADALDAHDAYPVLDGAGALLRTGATGTNVNDLRAVVVAEHDAPSGERGARSEGPGASSEDTK
ncbi:glycerate kinase type-2 family protein [Halorubrum xinjiangense]|uniref:glycerate kinase type-2 family protein n=1 Tax=Halorubrum xinjiangense TaxID=261291 RepID=UPI003C6F39FC